MNEHDLQASLLALIQYSKSELIQAKKALSDFESILMQVEKRIGEDVLSKS
jgi:hypothetical protein